MSSSAEKLHVSRENPSWRVVVNGEQEVSVNTFLTGLDRQHGGTCQECRHLANRTLRSF